MSNVVGTLHAMMEDHLNNYFVELFFNSIPTEHREYPADFSRFEAYLNPVDYSLYRKIDAEYPDAHVVYSGIFEGFGYRAVYDREDYCFVPYTRAGHYMMNTGYTDIAGFKGVPHIYLTRKTAMELRLKDDPFTQTPGGIWFEGVKEGSVWSCNGNSTTFYRMPDGGEMEIHNPAPNYMRRLRETCEDIGSYDGTVFAGGAISWNEHGLVANCDVNVVPANGIGRQFVIQNIDPGTPPKEMPNEGAFTQAYISGKYETTGKTVDVDDLDDLFDRIDALTEGGEDD